MPCASSCRTAKQTLCSELAWEIMITFTPASRTVLKMVLAVPGTPTMPVPCRQDLSHQLDVLHNGAGHHSEAATADTSHMAHEPRRSFRSVMGELSNADWRSRAANLPSPPWAVAKHDRCLVCSLTSTLMSATLSMVAKPLTVTGPLVSMSVLRSLI